MESFVLRQLGNLLVEEAKYLDAVSRKVECLKGDLKLMEGYLQDADKKEHEEQLVKECVAEIRDLAYDAQDIIERYVHQVSHHEKNGIWNALKWFSCLICDAWPLHKIGSDIDDLTTKIKEYATILRERGIRSVGQSESSTDNDMVRELRCPYPHIEEKDIVGLEKDIEKVVDLLLNTESRVVGIGGMGGLGKTTLAKKVYSNITIRQHFNSYVLVYVSQKVERGSVFKEILSVQDERENTKEMRDQDLAAEICKLLTSKKCLVVLDDIWTVEAWKLLEPAFASIESSPSKILLTTRNKVVLQHQYPVGLFYPLRFLDEAEAWRLLKLKVFSGRENQDAMMDPKMEELGKKMVKHCEGLPLAITILGGILASKKTVHQWKTVQDNITSCLTRETKQGGGGISQVLEMSFYDLPFYLKPCFLYLGSFPEDHEILADRLYHLWEAEGIISVSTDDEAQIRGGSLDEIAERCLNELVQRSMVQVGKCWSNGRIKSCRLHDVMRDICLKKCKEINFSRIVKLNDTDKSSSCSTSSSTMNYRLRRCVVIPEHISMSPNLAIFDQHKKNPCLRSLLMFAFDERDIKGLFSLQVKTFSLLRVLHLESVLGWGLKDDILCHFKTIGELIHLRYLSLRHAPISGLPSCIWDFKHLETLDLRSCGQMLLHNKFWKLERLRHVYLPRWFVVKGDEKLIIKVEDNQLARMETLINFDHGRCQVEDLLKMENLRHFSISKDCTCIDLRVWKVLSESPLMTSERLMNHLKLEINATVINEEPTALISPKVQASIHSLIIRGPIKVQSHQYQATRVFPRSLRSLNLTGSKIDEYLFSQLKELPHLRKLCLLVGSIRGNKMSFPDRSFLQLEELSLEYVKDLEELEVGIGSLPNLRRLSIVRCTNLKMVPEGLPSSIHIFCVPCVRGIEKYNTCIHFRHT